MLCNDESWDFTTEPTLVKDTSTLTGDLCLLLHSQMFMKQLMMILGVKMVRNNGKRQTKSNEIT